MDVLMTQRRARGRREEFLRVNGDEWGDARDERDGDGGEDADDGARRGTSGGTTRDGAAVRSCGETEWAAGEFGTFANHDALG